MPHDMPVSTMNISLEDELALYDRYGKPFSVGVTVVVICYTQIVLAFVSNIIALFALHQGKITLDDITRLFFKALSLTNLIVGVIYPFTYSFISLDHVSSFTRPKQLYDIICRWFQSFFTAPLVLALLIIACVNLNKYLMISKPLRYHSLVTPLRARMAIVAVVFLAIAYSMLFASFPTSPYARYSNNVAESSRTSSSESTLIKSDVCNRDFSHVHQAGRSWLLIEICILTPIIVMTTALNARMLHISLKLSKRHVAPRPLRLSLPKPSEPQYPSTTTTTASSSPPSSSSSSSSSPTCHTLSSLHPFCSPHSSPSPFLSSSPRQFFSSASPSPSPSPPPLQPLSCPFPSPPSHISPPFTNYDPQPIKHPPAISSSLSYIQEDTTSNPLTHLSSPPPPNHLGLPSTSHPPSHTPPQWKKKTRHSKHVTNRYQLKRSDRKAIRTIAVITATFYIIWVPLIIYDILNYIEADIRCFVPAVKLILMASTWWNTLLYIGTDKKFRNHVYQCVKQLVPCKYKNKQFN